MYLKFILLVLPLILCCATHTPRLVIKYSEDGKLLTLKNLCVGQQPTWSPLGDKIAYVDQGVHLMDGNGMNQVQLTKTGEAPCFSPDGQKLAYEDKGSIWLFDFKTNTREQIIKAGQHPVWSPDGKKIVFIANGLLSWDIEKSEAATLLPNGLNPEWSTNGKQIFFDALYTPQLYFNIWRYDFGKKKLKKILDDAIQPNVSADGNYLLYSSTGIWLLPLKSNESIRLTLYGYEPAYSPKGDKILFSFKGDIWIMDAPYLAAK